MKLSHNRLVRFVFLFFLSFFLFNVLASFAGTISFWVYLENTWIPAHTEWKAVGPAGTEYLPYQEPGYDYWDRLDVESHWGSGWVLISMDYDDDDTKEPIDTATGNNYFTEKGLYVPCPGISLELDFKYQSISEHPTGIFGGNWVHSYEWKLNIEADQATLFPGLDDAVVFGRDENDIYYPPATKSWMMETNSIGYSVHIPPGVDYVFNSTGRLETVQDRWDNRVDCSYGTNGCLEAVTHSNGRRILFSNCWNTVSEKWQIDSIEVDGGASLAFSYGTDGQFTQIIEQVDANCYTSSYQYANGFLTNRMNGAGFNYAYRYQSGYYPPSGKCVHLDVDGYYDHNVAYLSDSLTDVTYQRRGESQFFRYARNDDGRLEYQYGPAKPGVNIGQRGTHYAYSGVEKTEETQFDYDTGAIWSEWMLYDHAHNLTNYAVSFCSANKVQQSSMNYDTECQLPSVIREPDGSRTEIEYTNGLVRVRKAFISETQSYDTHYTYTAMGQPETVKNANSHITTFGYNASGDLISTTPPLGPVVTNGYNALGYVETMEVLSENGASTGRITHYENDAQGRTVGIVYPDGLSESFAFNALGYLTNSTDRAGRITDYTYAPTKMLTSVTRYLNQNGSNVPVRIGYNLDTQLNVLRISEPRSRYVESYQLDIQDRVTAITNIEDQVMTMDYIIGDFVEHVERFDGTAIHFAYDAAGRQTNETYSSAGVPLANISRSYHADGRLASVNDASSFVAYEYNLLNQLASATSSVPSVSSVVNHQYDAEGNVTNSIISIGGTPSSSSAYTYDAAERLKNISATAGAGTQHFVYEYDPANGQIASVSNTVSGITCSYQYDIMDRATNIAYRTAAGSLIRSLDYTYDSVGMIRKKRISNSEQGTPNTEVSYAYDSIDRLVHETRTAGILPALSATYQYDLAGNRLSKTDGSKKTTYTLGSGNRLASSSTSATTGSLFVSGSSSENIGTDDRWGELYVSNVTAGASVVPSVSGCGFHATVPALTGQTNSIVAAIRDAAGNTSYVTKEYWVGTTTGGATSSSTYQYNAAGCLTNLNGTSLQWDERYRLTNASFVQYEYDVLGRRVSRTAGGSPAEVEQYVYNDNQVVADLGAAGNLLRTYVWGPGIDNLLSFTDHASGTTYYAIKDHQNSVLAFVNESGAIIESYEYDAYGNTTIFDASGSKISESAIGNRYMFQGREYDSATGLYYFRARWYDPETGRWLSKDPIGIAGGLNLYVFCGNNPVNFVDSLGLMRTYLDKNPEQRTDAVRNDGAGSGAQGFSELSATLAVAGVAIAKKNVVVGAIIGAGSIPFGVASAALGRLDFSDDDNDNDGIPDVDDFDDDNDGILDCIDNDQYRHRDYDGDLCNGGM